MTAARLPVWEMRPSATVNVFHSRVNVGFFPRRSAAGSGSLVGKAPAKFMRHVKLETGNSHKRRSAKQADRHGVLGYKGARSKTV